MVCPRKRLHCECFNRHQNGQSIELDLWWNQEAILVVVYIWWSYLSIEISVSVENTPHIRGRHVLFVAQRQLVGDGRLTWFLWRQWIVSFFFCHPVFAIRPQSFRIWSIFSWINPGEMDNRQWTGFNAPPPPHKQKIFYSYSSKRSYFLVGINLKEWIRFTD